MKKRWTYSLLSFIFAAAGCSGEEVIKEGIPPQAEEPEYENKTL